MLIRSLAAGKRSATVGRAMRVAAALFVLLIAGCSGGVRVQTDFDTQVNFKAYRTWDWLPDGREETGDRRIDDPKTRARLEQIFVKALVERGYVQDVKSPDFYVNYHAAIDEQLNERNIGNYYEFINYSVFYPHWVTTYSEVHDIGAILLDILDPVEKKLVWRGYAQTEINWQAGPKENRPKIEKAVKEMLKQFPPKT